MKCIFKHKWVYSKPSKRRDNLDNVYECYEERTCHKCGKIQHNHPYIDTSFGRELIGKWFTVGYATPNTGKVTK